MKALKRDLVAYLLMDQLPSPFRGKKFSYNNLFIKSSTYNIQEIAQTR